MNIPIDMLRFRGRDEDDDGLVANDYAGVHLTALPPSHDNNGFDRRKGEDAVVHTSLDHVVMKIFI